MGKSRATTRRGQVQARAGRRVGSTGALGAERPSRPDIGHGEERSRTAAMTAAALAFAGHMAAPRLGTHIENILLGPCSCHSDVIGGDGKIGDAPARRTAGREKMRACVYQSLLWVFLWLYIPF